MTNEMVESFFVGQMLGEKQLATRQYPLMDSSPAPRMFEVCRPFTSWVPWYSWRVLFNSCWFVKIGSVSKQFSPIPPDKILEIRHVILMIILWIFPFLFYNIDLADRNREIHHIMAGCHMISIPQHYIGRWREPVVSMLFSLIFQWKTQYLFLFCLFECLSNFTYVQEHTV